jgi:hypothetical protein
VWEIVVVVTAGPQHRELLAREEAWKSMTWTLRHSRKCQTYGPDTVLQIVPPYEVEPSESPVRLCQVPVEVVLKPA